MPKSLTPKTPEIILALLATAISGFSQTPSSIFQRAKYSTCSNIVAIAGNVNIKCSSLTPAQKKLIGSIPSLLNKIISNQLDPDTVNARLDEMLSDVKNIKQGVVEIGEKMENKGLLTPDDEPFPVEKGIPESCWSLIPDSATRVYFGGNVQVVNPKVPFFIVSIAGDPMLWVRVTPDGISIYGHLYSEDGILVEFKDNEF